MPAHRPCSKPCWIKEELWKVRNFHQGFEHAHVEHAGPQAMLEALVEVADLPELFFNPAGFDAALEITEGGCRRVALFERFEGRLGGERAALDRQVDALQPGGIQESCRVP